LETQKNKRSARMGERDHEIVPGLDIIDELYPLSGEEALQKILEQENPGRLVRRLPSGDFFWLVKKVGDNDCLPLLELATEDQRQYLLDLEIWKRDHLDMEQVFQWLVRLYQADPGRFAAWLFGKGRVLAYSYFVRTIQVEIREDDDAADPEEGSISLDGIHYVRVLDRANSEIIQDMLLRIGKEDPEEYRNLLFELAGILPSDIEENMYRLRSVRLAEHGFIPFEEALSVYAPLDPETLSTGSPPRPPLPVHHKELNDLMPVSPLYHVEGKNLLTEAVREITDDIFRDRIRMEFAGLCNQIASADLIPANELETLINTCQKTAGYLNLILEKLCGESIDMAQEILKNNPLVAIFRAGFGLILGLRWEAERWLKESWFRGHGLDFSFWGDVWGGTLKGILAKKPLLYAGFGKGEEYGHFEKLSELNDCRIILRQIMVLDRLLGRLTGIYSLKKKDFQTPDATFHPLLFNLWARQLLNLDLSFSRISPEEAREFFGLIRGDREMPPYGMSPFEEDFIKDFLAYTSGFDKGDVTTIQETLPIIWQEFKEEYEWVSGPDMDGRFTKFIRIMT